MTVSVRRSRVAAVLAAVVGLSFLAGPARADGGSSIASATAVSPGTQQFGNTANGSKDDCYFRQYWSLTVTAGDEIMIDWEAPEGSEPRLGVYPVGTTDFNVGDTSYLESFYLNSNNKAQSSFSASKSGSMPLQFRADGCDDEEGPYAFTARVTHQTVVSLAPGGSLRRRGSLNVSARTSAGTPVPAALGVHLQVKPDRGDWVTVGSVAASGQDWTAVPYQVPGSVSGTVQVRAMVGGGDYRTGFSPTQKMTVTGASGGGGGGKKPLRVKLSGPRSADRLDTVVLRGRVTGARAGTGVRIMQRQVGGARWFKAGSTTVRSGGAIRFSEVVHKGDRYYQACVRSTCSRSVLVRIG